MGWGAVDVADAELRDRLAALRMGLVVHPTQGPFERGAGGMLADAVATSIGAAKAGFAYRVRFLVYLLNTDLTINPHSYRPTPLATGHWTYSNVHAILTNPSTPVT
jgi:hypothetical protein